MCKVCHVQDREYVPSNNSDGCTVAGQLSVVLFLNRYPVSNYARDLLNRFYSEPVFTAVPKDIYQRVPLMAQARVSLDHVT